MYTLMAEKDQEALEFMEGRRRISRASSASILVADRRRGFNAGSNQMPKSRPTSANSYKSAYLRNEVPFSSDRARSLLPYSQKWTLSSQELSPNVRRAISIAANQAYKNIQQVFYGDSSAEKTVIIKKETRADLMLDRFLEKIRRLKTGEASRETRTEHSCQPGSDVAMSSDIEQSDDLQDDTLIERVKRSKADVVNERNRRPGSAAVSRESTTKERHNKPIDVKRQISVCSYDTADSIVERRERIRNRSMHIEQHVIEARERIRKAKIRRHAQIHAITAALESNQIDQERIREDAVLTAKQRLWRWRAQHRGDDSDPVYKYKTIT